MEKRKKKWNVQMVDYRSFRLSKINTEEFCHLKWLLFWPVFGFFFLFVERIWTDRDYVMMHCELDDMIPFCEYFVFAYLFWFVFLVGISVYSLLFDVETFKRFMRYVAITYSVAMIMYLIWPTAQELRPETFARDNVLTRFMSYFYQFDTNTNVCPSIHVIGSVAVAAAAWNSRHLSTPGWRAAFVVMAFLICISTVFLKQHSVMDIWPALIICVLAYPPVFGSRPVRVVRTLRSPVSRLK